MDLVEHPGEAARTRSVDRLFGTHRALVGWAWANLVANAVLVVTGAVVRLTDSGLGCPTWPRCNDTSYVTTPAMGVHGVIEFTNRMLTFVLIAIAVALVVTAVRTRASQRIRLLGWVALLGLPFQGVIGGVTVLSHLNPYVVALHLLLSIALVVVGTWLVQLAQGLQPEPLPQGLRRLVTLLFWVMMVAIWLGTVVTGAGPHSGDHGAKRNGLDIEQVAKVHALAVWVAVGLTLILLVQFRRQALAVPLRFAVVLLGVELLQGAIGYAQYFAGLPLWLVVCHMAGITLVTAAVSWLWFGTRRGVPATS